MTSDLVPSQWLTTLHLPWAQLTPTDAAALVTLEKRLDYDRIVLFRSLAEAYLEKEKQFKEREKQKRIESEKATGAASSDYGNGIWKWWTGAAADTTPTPDLELTDAVWKELFAAVNDEYLSVSSSSDQVNILPYRCCEWSMLMLTVVGQTP